MFSCLCKHKLKHQENNISESNYEQEFKILCWPFLMLGGVLAMMTEDIGVLLHWLSSWWKQQAEVVCDCTTVALSVLHPDIQVVRSRPAADWQA